MIGRLWRRLRRDDDVESLETALQTTVERFRVESARADRLTGELESERARRIGAESLAGERRAEVERLVEELREARATTERVLGERLKSLDSLNVRLMEPRVEPPPPDMKQYAREATGEVVGQALRQVRDIHSHVDAELIKLALRRGKRLTPATLTTVEEGA